MRAPGRITAAEEASAKLHTVLTSEEYALVWKHWCNGHSTSLDIPLSPSPSLHGAKPACTMSRCVAAFFVFLVRGRVPRSQVDNKAGDQDPQAGLYTTGVSKQRRHPRPDE
jgi:hypothetical protein